MLLAVHCSDFIDFDHELIPDNSFRETSDFMNIDHAMIPDNSFKENSDFMDIDHMNYGDFRLYGY